MHVNDGNRLVVAGYRCQEITDAGALQPDKSRTKAQQQRVESISNSHPTVYASKGLNSLIYDSSISMVVACHCALQLFMQGGYNS